MKVCELIEILNELPQECEVFAINADGYEFDIRPAFFHHDERYGPVGQNSQERVLIPIQ